MEQFLSFLRRLNWWQRIVALIAAAILVFFASATLSSCSHSAMLFRGHGDIEYYYNGSGAAPQLPTEKPVALCNEE